MRARIRVDQLSHDAQLIARPPRTPLDDVAGAQHGADAADVGRLIPQGEGRIARDDHQLAIAGEVGDDVLGEAVGEIGLRRIAAHIVERQNGDGRPRVRDERFPRRPVAGLKTLGDRRDQAAVEDPEAKGGQREHAGAGRHSQSPGLLHRPGRCARMRAAGGPDRIDLDRLGHVLRPPPADPLEALGAASCPRCARPPR